MRMINGNVERIADTEAQAAKFRVLGYKELKEGTAVHQMAAKKPLDKMTMPELKDLAKERGIDGAGSLTKAEILEALKDVSDNDGA